MNISDIENPLPQVVIDAFIKLANDQRGDPEIQMVKIQHLMGGGVLNPVIEHVGDLTNRMTAHIKWGSNKTQYDVVMDKVDKTYRILNSSYGFEREFEENITSNAAYRKIDPVQFKTSISKELSLYGSYHSKLTVYNKVQFYAREAAVALGFQDWGSARTYLRRLRSYDEPTYQIEAIKYELDSSGNIIPYKNYTV